MSGRWYAYSFGVGLGIGVTTRAWPLVGFALIGMWATETNERNVREKDRQKS